MAEVVTGAVAMNVVEAVRDDVVEDVKISIASVEVRSRNNWNWSSPFK